jgi:hypothetical protein
VAKLSADFANRVIILWFFVAFDTALKIRGNDPRIPNRHRSIWVPSSNRAKTYGKAPYEGETFPVTLFRESVYPQQQTWEGLIPRRTL